DKLSGVHLALASLPVGTTLLILLGIFILITFIAGSYPALSLCASNSIDVLKGSFRAKKSTARLRRWLVVFQFAIAVFLILSTFVIRGQLSFLQTKNLGFDKNHVVMIPSHDPAIKDAFKEVKGVQNVSLANGYPSRLGWTSSATAPSA